MKALSLWQPWASLMAFEEKKEGNRMLWNWDYVKRVDKKVCRKEQGIVEPGNTCL